MGYCMQPNGTTLSAISYKSNPVLISLDVACGSTCPAGWVGIDSVSLPGVDIVHDLLIFPWPIATESVAQIRCYHYLEHIPLICAHTRNQSDLLLQTFDELYRVLIPGGTVFVECPHASSLRASQDPTHCRFISENTFAYTNQQWRIEHGVAHYPIRCDFDATWKFISDEHGAIQDIQVQMTKKV